MTTATEAEFLVTACPDHGDKIATDLTSARVYAQAALDDDHGWIFDADEEVAMLTPAHAVWHHTNGTEPWRCCYHMEIDPKAEILDFDF